MWFGGSGVEMLSNGEMLVHKAAIETSHTHSCAGWCHASSSSKHTRLLLLMQNSLH